MPEIIELFKITIDREGPAIDVVGLLDHFPENPPQKWIAARSNCVLATIRLDGIRDAICGHWTTANVGRWTLQSLALDGVEFRFSTDSGVVLEGKAAVARLQGFSHYWG
jgi:hypothetical protein